MYSVQEMLKKTFTLAKALLYGKDVSVERLEKRLQICSTCDQVEHSGTLMKCGICGCQIKEQGLINLARYIPTGDYGCHHPDGSRWVKLGADPPPGKPDNGQLPIDKVG